MEDAMTILALIGAIGAWYCDQRMNRMIALAFLVLGVSALLVIEAIDVGRDFVREVGDVEVEVRLEY